MPLLQAMSCVRLRRSVHVPYPVTGICRLGSVQAGHSHFWFHLCSGLGLCAMMGLSLYVGEHAKTIFFEDVPEKDMFQTGNRVFFFQFCEINNWPSFPKISKINQIYTRKIKFPKCFVKKTRSFVPKKITGWQHALYGGVGQFYGLE